MVGVRVLSTLENSQKLLDAMLAVPPNAVAGHATVDELIEFLSSGVDEMCARRYSVDEIVQFVRDRVPEVSAATLKSGLYRYFRKKKAPRRRSRASAGTSKRKRTSPPGQRSGDSAGSADGIASGTRTVTAPDIARQAPAASVVATPPARKEAPGVPVVTPPRAAPPAGSDDFDPFTDTSPEPRRSMYDRSLQGTSVGLTSRI